MAASRPVKGILKNKSSIKARAEEPVQDTPEPGAPFNSEDDQEKKSQKWDEMNILATYHPADKDYGLMKIDEPDTPFNRIVRDDEDEGAISDSEGNTVLPGDVLAKKLAVAATEDVGSRFMEEPDEESSEEEEEELGPEDQARKKQFQMMRKMHYNEGMNIKLARQLIASEQEEEEEDEDEEMKDDTETEDITVDPPQDDSLES
ncbi:protein phosphatase inhibitor 2 isoform X2 [Carassius gibelio]|uniref:protein phosphatase inhibitor 2 isoform X2 n=1 Tax=Carassius gibelio TaxID=101364 RepID=UPI002279228D|nr:protein phosphatase inhibitor 2 isoform X2 [Carassius gibelio]